MDISKTIAQNVIVEFYDKRNSIKLPSSLKSYLYLSAKIKCNEHVKDVNEVKNLNTCTLSDEVGNDNNLDDMIEKTEMENRIYKILKFSGKSMPSKNINRYTFSNK